MNFFLSKFLHVYIKEIIILCFITSITSVFTLLSPLLVQKIIDEVILKNDFSLLSIILIILFMLYLLSALSIFIQNYIAEYLKIKIFQDKLMELIPIIISSKKYFNSGDLISRLIDNLRSINLLLSLFIPNILLNIFTLIASLVIMSYINLKLCIVTIAPTFLFVLTFYLLGNSIEKIEKKILEINGQIFFSLKEIFSLNDFIKSYSIQDLFLKKLILKLKLYKKETLRYAKYSSINLSSEYLLTGIPLLILIIYGCNLIINNELSLGGFIAFMTYLSLFFSPIMNLSSNWIAYKSTLPAIDRIKEIYDLEYEEIGKSELFLSEGIIEFKNVHFSYENKADVLKDFNQIFYPGINYLIGDNGSGKSTILKLICKLYSPQEGLIEIDNQNIENISSKSLSKNVGIVFSNSYFFEDTIYNNIILGNQSFKMEAVFEICKKVKIHNFIMSLPNQYNTIINEDGLNLSSGEKQKIALARVLLRNPKILLLDEVTGSIDKKSRIEIHECLRSFKEEKTVIVINHDFNETFYDYIIKM